MKQLSLLPDGAELSYSAPALDKLKLTIKHITKTEKAETFIALHYKLENGEDELTVIIYPPSIIKCLEEAEYARWRWLNPIRKEKRFVDIIERLKKFIF